MYQIWYYQIWWDIGTRYVMIMRLQIWRTKPDDQGDLYWPYWLSVVIISLVTQISERDLLQTICNLQLHLTNMVTDMGWGHWYSVGHEVADLDDKGFVIQICNLMTYKPIIHFIPDARLHGAALAWKTSDMWSQIPRYQIWVHGTCSLGHEVADFEDTAIDASFQMPIGYSLGTSWFMTYPYSTKPDAKGGLIDQVGIWVLPFWVPAIKQTSHKAGKARNHAWPIHWAA